MDVYIAANSFFVDFARPVDQQGGGELSDKRLPLRPDCVSKSQNFGPNWRLRYGVYA